MSRYYIQGKQIQLGKNDFKAQGGEGSIYVKGSTAYKIYRDKQRTITATKIQELSVLSLPNIIRPLSLLLDEQNQPVGYAMRYVGKTHALCQLFPKAFRQRYSFTPETCLRLVQKLQAGITHIHSKQILLVDLNEMNFLVSPDFSELFFIDVDSYQTPSFPATVLMENVRDRHALRFTIGSDWFSFAVVSFQMFVGIHPFKGTYVPLQSSSNKDSKLDARMRANISVLHPGVTVPGSCLPFSVIPPVYLDWYRAVFEEGKRVPPPHDARALLPLTISSELPTLESSAFVIDELREFDAQIISYDGLITVTEKSVYFEGRQYKKPPCDVKLAISPRLRHLIAVFSEGTKLRFRDLTTDQDIVCEVEGDDVMVSNGRIYLKQLENIFAIDFIELAQSIVPSLRPVANVMMRATQLFEGLAIHNLLGTNYAAILLPSGACQQIRLPELDTYKVVSARLERNLAFIVATQAGRYDKLIYKFDSSFRSYELRTVCDISSSDINFTVLDSGIVLQLTDEGYLEVFSTHRNSSSLRILKDSLLQTDVRLMHTGKQALLARGKKLLKLNLQS